MTTDDFIAKIRWEGGITGALEYGLGGDDLEGVDPVLAALWDKAQGLWLELDPVLYQIDRFMSDYDRDKREAKARRLYLRPINPDPVTSITKGPA
jgi:hypothetical protein